MIDKISKAIQSILKLDYKPSVEIPADGKFGHYSTNLALIEANKKGKAAAELAHELIHELKEADKDGWFEKIETAGPGFINFTLSQDLISGTLNQALKKGDNYGKKDALSGEKVIVEFTDPNPFKQFHIGHLMTNTIGEALSRNLEWAGAELARANYQGDVGMHVAKSIYGIQKNISNLPGDSSSLEERAQYLGNAYALGATKFKKDESAKAKITELNKKVFTRSDKEINDLYDKGKAWSLEYFEKIYQRLGTKFDYYFFESEAGKFGEKLVRKWFKKGVFDKSNGAIVFDGEKHGLHTRVFINSEGLPTYEAKELGLAKLKHKKFKYTRSIIVTGNEIKAYFQVLIKAMSFVFPKLAERTEHFPHGMLRLPEGKMSSRTGDIVEAEALLDEIEKAVETRMKNEGFSLKEKEKIVSAVSVAAVKYSILKAAPKNDIVFDLESSISLNGSSGPYIQYAHARLSKILSEESSESQAKFHVLQDKEAKDLVNKLIYFPDVVSFAAKNLSTNHIATYAYQLAKLANRFYEEVPILKEGDEEIKNAKLALAQLASTTIKNALNILGIEAPERI